ncbi:CDP-glycerol glycerophosphotransferase (TagB/SpsB family) [Curtobacterium sp. PhB130]|uniref:bifunctional glycosyltransferase/CDP-glycerol:glycerophosphate glycerophosphotransferase n=1 Tax=Curtobacterium sp. PhB130 TaxID=2485178 RepID=UPI000F4CD8A4|nr:CDP-glycerol glycerophosphotransferase family protein [Curtobacterium sp. PhB130]ROS72307.1 CDP-glycerol glycerophosphotransferase (TagB/SpsB family) [Curtobacterium sp. PhB130]
MPANRRPLISAVVPTYNVADYLPAFLDSIQAQTSDMASVEIIVVIDGSPDDSASIVREWASQRSLNVNIIEQENQGLSGARNTGLAAAQGEWVTFPDPDDELDPQYFEEVEKFLRLHGRADALHPVNLAAAHQLRLTPAGEIVDNHPQRTRFKLGSRIVDMAVEPIIQLSVNSSFIRVDLLREKGIEFDGRVRPTFEDGHLTARYLLETGSHHLGLMASAKYRYRLRGDGSSLVEGGFSKPEKYTNQVEFGYLDLLERATAQLGRAPRWLENTVLYDLHWYFKGEQSVHSTTASAPLETLPRFHELVERILSLLSEDAVRSFDVTGMEFAVRHALMYGYEDIPLRHDWVKLSDVDERRQQMKVSYWFTGPVPVERFELDAEEAGPVHETVRDYTFFGRVLMRERHLWFPRGRRLEMWLDGQKVHFTRWNQNGHPDALTPALIDPQIRAIRRRVRADFSPTTGLKAHARARAGKLVRDLRNKWSDRGITDEAMQWLVRSPKIRRQFEHAWVFMDRDTDANDNAEHLYRWVRKNRPEVNAWFVLRRDSADWDRLEREGFRLVEPNTTRWKLLLLHADHLASSHADHYVTDPLDRRRYGRHAFRFTFLQHGVINYDMSRWLSWKGFDRFVTTTHDEFDAIAGHGPYSFSSHEVVLTGLPRHDALQRKREESTVRDLIVIMPTWRQWLLGDRIGTSNDRKRIPDFRSTEYAQMYEALLNSEELAELARETGKRIAFMPHPNVRQYLSEFELLAHVQLFSFADQNVQDVIARAAAFVTDYSSLGFEAAFVDVPLTYFQFDSERFFDGTHVGRRGYFDYERDGFGPIARDVPAVIASIREAAANDWESPRRYRDRTAATFHTRDGGSSERVFQAMLGLDQPEHAHAEAPLAVTVEEDESATETDQPAATQP